MYAFDADVNNARVVSVPRRADFSIDVPAVLAAAAASAPKMLFLTSPNNPDGCVLGDDELRALLALPTLVVLDEAYVEFASEPSRIGWVLAHENLVVLRTFSKRAGLAGLRIGYGAFPKSLIEFLWRAKQPYNVSVAAEVAAVAALSNGAYLTRVRDALVGERERLFAMLSRIPGLSPYPSAANFVLCRCGAGLDAKALQQRLMHEEGIMVRYYASPAQLAGCIRVSVGTPSNTDALEKALRRLVAAP
jgi:histidinol-phosphate aminotransferase